MVGTRSRAIRGGTSRSSFSASPMAAHAGTADMAFVRVYGRATPDRAGARPYHGGRTYTLCRRTCAAPDARERIPTVAGGAAPSYHFYGAYQRLNSNQKQGPFRQSFFGTFLTQESPSIKDAQILNQLLPAEECEAPIH